MGGKQNKQTKVAMKARKFLEGGKKVNELVAGLKCSNAPLYCSATSSLKYDGAHL